MFLPCTLIINQKLQMTNTDEQLEELFHCVQIKEPELRCNEQHIIDKLCISSQCEEYALHCSNKKCQTSFVKHLYCKVISFEGVTSLLNKPLMIRKQFMKKLFVMENKMIDELIKSREEIVKRLDVGTLEEKHRKMVEEIYCRKNKQTAKGKEISELYNQLCQNNKRQNTGIGELLDYFSIQQKDILKQIMDLKQKIFHKVFLDDQDQTDQIQIIEVLSTNNLLTIDSKIIAQSSTKFEFIKNMLNSPKKIQLLYRGSEDGFRSATFHQKCDNIQGTLVLVQTEFKKTIGGYTPLAWNSATGYAADNSERTFIFSLDLLQVMTLIQPSKAIVCKPEYGPIFGGGSDFRITDKCNQKNTSYSNFPFSYNYNNQYVNNQKTHTAFCGCPNGRNFKVIQIQVFRVIQKQQ